MDEGGASVRLQSPHAEKQSDAAPAGARDALRRRARDLVDDPQAGTFIAIAQVPEKTRQRWEARVGPVTNLWKLDLPRGWRALYTVGSDAGVRVVLVLEEVTHREYDRLLGYG